jgi:hypothetical protein
MNGSLDITCGRTIPLRTDAITPLSLWEEGLEVRVSG